jgi:hypothetical protein
MTFSQQSVDAKLKRADEHLQTFEREVDTWFDQDSYQLVCESNADHTRHTVIARLNPTRRPPDFERWSLIFADAIHNLRSALDHLVYAIAERQMTPWPPDIRTLKALSFVIADTPDQWNADSRRKLRFLHPDVLTAMESVQPYNRQNEFRPPLLSLLRDLDDFDKHRLLALTLTYPVEILFKEVTWFVPGNTPSIAGHDGPVGDGTQLAVVSFAKPEPNVKIDFQTKLAVTVNHAPGPEGHSRSDAWFLFTKLLRPEVEEVIRVVSASV